MQKRDVPRGSNWADDEEFDALLGYLKYMKQQGMHVKLATLEVEKRFPTKRSLVSIERKLLNHQWWDTGEGHYDELNNWGKRYWQAIKTPAQFAALEEKQAALRAARKQLRA